MEDVLRGGSCRGGGLEATKSQPLLPIIEEGRRLPTVKLCQEGADDVPEGASVWLLFWSKERSSSGLAAFAWR